MRRWHTYFIIFFSFFWTKTHFLWSHFVHFEFAFGRIIKYHSNVAMVTTGISEMSAKQLQSMIGSDGFFPFENFYSLSRKKRGKERENEAKRRVKNRYPSEKISNSINNFLFKTKKKLAGHFCCFFLDGFEGNEFFAGNSALNAFWAAIALWK